MTILELIKQLTNIHVQHGNLDVTCRMPLPDLNLKVRPHSNGDLVLVLNDPVSDKQCQI